MPNAPTANDPSTSTVHRESDEYGQIPASSPTRPRPSGPEPDVPMPVDRHPAHHPATRSPDSAGRRWRRPTGESPSTISDRDPKPSTATAIMMAKPPGPNTAEKALFKCRSPSDRSSSPASTRPVVTRRSASHQDARWSPTPIDEGANVPTPARRRAEPSRRRFHGHAPSSPRACRKRPVPMP